MRKKLSAELIDEKVGVRGGRVVRLRAMRSGEWREKRGG